MKSLAGVRYVYQTNHGPAAARNHGFRISQGNLLCFLDADDRLTRSKTEIQFSMLAENRALDIVIGFSQRVVIAGWDGAEPVYTEIGDPVFYLHLGSAIIRRTVFERVGLFDENLAVTPEHRSTAAVGEEVEWYFVPRKSESECAFTRRSCSTACVTTVT